MAPAGDSTGVANMDVEPFCKRIPKLRSGSVAANKATAVHKSLVKLTHLLYNNPELILETLAVVEDKVSSATSELGPKSIDEPTFDKKVVTFKSLPPEWFASWLQGQSDGLLTDDLFAKVLQKNSQNLERLKVFSTQLPANLTWSGDLSYKKIAARALDSRARSLENPVKRTWVQRAIDVTGCFRFEFQGGRAKFIVHRAGEKQGIPEHCYIDKTFQVVDSWSDQDANVQKLPSVFVCHEFFATDSKVINNMIRETKPTAVFRTIGEIAKQVKSEADAATKGNLSENTSLLQAARDAKRKVSSEKARVCSGDQQGRAQEESDG